jgi:poly(beta-D-mannuronate) lyase
MTRLYTVAALICVLAMPVQAQDTAPADPAAAKSDEKKPFVCFKEVAPVIELGHPSRYADDSKNRSDFDEQANAAVNAALKPIDRFITDLAVVSDIAVQGGEDAPKAADCVVDRIHAWASADALSKMTTDSANLSVPSRIGGIAFAHAKVSAMLKDDPRLPVIDAWLRERMQASMDFFDEKAPPRASRNNLRAWAALAAARVGLTVNDAAMVTWATESTRLVACEAAADGSLPNEMWRGNLALHYQIHATGPLVVTAALLEPTGADLFNACDKAIPRIVGFVLRALEDEAEVQAVSGKAQKFGKPEPHEFAWTQAYLSVIDDPAVADLARQFKTTGNSKLGGDQALMW